MIDAETKKRLDELEELVRSQAQSARTDAVEIAVGIFALVAVGLAVVVVLSWDWICAMIALNILEQLAGELPAVK